MTTITEALKIGLAEQQAGNLAAAEEIYRRVLAVDPNCADAWHFWGVLLHGVGQNERAAECIAKAVTLMPADPNMRCNLGEILRILRRFDEAEAMLCEAARLRPDLAGVYINLGILYLDQNRHAESLATFERALQLDPNSGPLQNNLGNLYKALGRPLDAEHCYRHAVQILPSSAAALNNLGAVLQEQQRYEEALGVLQAAIQLAPQLAELYVNLGVVFKTLGRLDDATACYRTALQIQPNLVMAHNNLGTVLQEQGRFDDAVTEYREALRLKPDFHQCASNILFCLNHSPGVSRADAVAAHREWGRGVESSLPPPAPFTNDRSPERRLRIGYVSGDFRAHALHRFFEPVLANHDPRKFEVFCYADVRHPDAVTAEFQQLAHRFQFTPGLSDVELAALIRRDEIDLVIDLAGHTAYNRLPALALRPAPLQGTFLGYPDTTGLQAITFRITDAVMDPLDEPTLGTEQLVRLACGVCCFAAMDDAPAVAPLPALSVGRITFGSLHRLSKVNPQVLETWAEILARVPGSRLLMMRDALVGERRAEIHDRLVALGVDSSRLDLRAFRSGMNHLATFAEIDISLDTFPYNGGTISCESTWMGAPVPTLRGDRPAARGGASLLTRLGLPELIAASRKEYVDKVVGLALDLDRLQLLRGTLRERMRSTYCDGPGFTRHLEAAYRELWRSWCGEVS